MNVVWNIFLHDIKRILKNPIAVLVTIGVCIIPSLYAWFNIAANWDPYKNTQTMPIAVVSEDVGAEVGSQGHINAGDLVVDKLKDNDQLQWTFVSKEEALDGVYSGRFYAAVVIPSNFTQSLASVISGNLEHPQIEYFVNEKLNPVAPKVTDSGAKTIETQINEQFLSKVAEVISEHVVDLAGTISSQVISSETGLAGDLAQTSNNLNEISSNLAQTSTALSDAQTTLAHTQSTLDILIKTSDSSHQTLADITSQLTQARNDTTTLASKLSSALAVGSAQLTDASNKANTAVGAITGRVSTALSTAEGSVTSAQSLVQSHQQLLQELLALRPLVPTFQQSQFDSVISTLTTQVSNEQAALVRVQVAVSDLEANNNSLSSVSNSLNNTITTSVSAAADAQNTLATTTIPGLNAAYDSFWGATNTLSSTTASIKPTLLQIKAILSQLENALAQAQDASQLTQNSLSNSAQTFSNLAADASLIQSSEFMKLLQNTMTLEPSDIAAYMAKPVTLTNQVIYPVANYGSSVAPFYTNLALWVGGFVLIAIYKLEVADKEIGIVTPWQAYFGRWILFMILGISQALICTIGDLAMGIQCVSPAGFIFAGIIESIVYVNIIYAFSIAFKHIGKGLCVLFVILQIPGTSGLYPIEMMPGFFQAIHPWLPFTYGIAAMRESIGGYFETTYATQLALLACFIIPALIIGVVLRRHLLNINALFDKKLSETGFMIHEQKPLTKRHLSLSTITSALAQSDITTVQVHKNGEKFRTKYPALKRAGIVYLLALPLILTVVMFGASQKLSWLIVWVISIVIGLTYLIVIEYIIESINYKNSMSELSKNEMLVLLQEEYGSENDAQRSFINSSIADDSSSMSSPNTSATSKQGE